MSESDGNSKLVGRKRNSKLLIEKNKKHFIEGEKEIANYWGKKIEKANYCRRKRKSKI